MRAFLLGAALLAIGAGACGGNDDNSDPNDPNDPVDPTDPTDPNDPPTPEEIARDNQQLATVLAAHVFGEFSFQLTAANISEGRYPEGFMQTSSTLEETMGVGSAGGLSYAFTYHCNDGTTAHMFVPCDGNAHHAHFAVTMTGAQTVGAMAMGEIDRTVDWEIRDLMLDKARFRGPDKMSLSTNVDGAEFKIQFNAVYEQVRFLPAYAFPTAGTIDFTVNAERTFEGDHRVFNSTAKITFAGGGVPTTLVVDDITYDFDLKTGAIVKL
jgi:hypothetical protein